MYEVYASLMWLVKTKSSKTYQEIRLEGHKQGKGGRRQQTPLRTLTLRGLKSAIPLWIPLLHMYEVHHL